MDFAQALSTRRSCRAYLPTPVPRKVITRVLALASRSASNSNSQPWHVHVVTGLAKRRLSAELLQAHAAGERSPEYDYQPSPDEWPEPFLARRRLFGDTLYSQALGLTRDNLAGRLDHHRRNYDFFGAPVGIVLTVSRGPLEGALVDAGLFLQSLMLAARTFGLDTCPQASLIGFSPVLRRILGIPADQLIVCGLSLGHADLSHPSTRCRTPREPVSAFTTFHDTED
jgi:nitroreductase